jgi:hypothetical protein
LSAVKGINSGELLIPMNLNPTTDKSMDIAKAPQKLIHGAVVFKRERFSLF